MEGLTEFHLEVWRSERSQGEAMPMASIHGRFPEETPGIGWISFYMTGEEFESLTTGPGFPLIFADGYHRLDRYGEIWHFYNIELPSGSGGETTVRYRTLNVPREAGQDLFDLYNNALETWDSPHHSSDRKEGNRVRIDLKPYVERWLTDYGQGSGSLKFDCNAQCADRLGALRGEKTFDSSMGTIERLALNGTWKKTDTATVRIYIESERALIWTAGGLHGGLINHGTESEPDWSVHT